MREAEDGVDLSPPGQAFSEALHEDLSCEESSCTGSLLNSAHPDEEPLLFLADVALAPPRGGPAHCSCLEARQKERHFCSIHLQLQFFLSKADDLHDRLLSGQNNLETESLVNGVSHLLYTCQPFFNYLESTTRSSVLQSNHAAVDLSPKMDASQQLCDRLERLVLTFASYDLLSLDETEPNKPKRIRLGDEGGNGVGGAHGMREDGIMSHFCIGQTRLGQLKLSIFRYCKPTPFQAQVNTGLYKRMRWNVERLRDGSQPEEDRHTDYYFLCYEDIPNTHADADPDGQGASDDHVLRMWSIGQWLQVTPDPETDSIHDWIVCDVAQAEYHRLLFLGHDEPSSCSATDCLQQLLHHTE